MQTLIPAPFLSNALSQEPKPTVLIVDDQHDSADTLASLLPFVFDCTAHVAYSGAAALAMVDRIHPQIVILDIAMPGMDGCETARRMRERPSCKGAFIVTLSGWDDGARCCEQAKVDVHLTKPVTIDELLDALAIRQACPSS